MKNKKDLFWFKCYPEKFISDIDLQVMSAEERGVCFWLWMNLYCNNGKLKYDPEGLAKICSTSDSVLKKIVSQKFNVQRGFVKSNKVTEIIKEAQIRRNKAVKAINTRWKSEYSSDTNVSKTNIPVEYKYSRVDINNKTNIQKEHFLNFTLEACKDTAPMVGLTEKDAEEFYHHFNASGWIRRGGQVITNLHSAMVTWRNNGTIKTNRQSDSQTKPMPAKPVLR